MTASLRLYYLKLVERAFEAETSQRQSGPDTASKDCLHRAINEPDSKPCMKDEGDRRVVRMVSKGRRL